MYGTQWCGDCKRAKAILRRATSPLPLRRRRRRRRRPCLRRGGERRQAGHPRHPVRRRLHARGAVERRAGGQARHRHGSIPLLLRPDRRRERPGRVSRPPCTPPARASRRLSSSAPASAARPASPSASTTFPAFPRASAGEEFAERLRSTGGAFRRRNPRGNRGDRPHRADGSYRCVATATGGDVRLLRSPAGARLHLPPPRRARGGGLHRRRRPLLRNL